MSVSLAAGQQHELLLASNNHNRANAFTIGKGGSDLFCLVIQIEKIHGLLLSNPVESPDNISNNDNAVLQAWLSYTYLGTVIQTKKFQIQATGIQDFAAIADGFMLRSSVLHLAEFFADEANGILKVFLCADGTVLGTATVDIQRMLSLEGEEDFVQRTGRGEFAIERRESNSNCSIFWRDAVITKNYPSIQVAVLLKREETGSTLQVIESSTTVSSQTSPKPNKRQEPELPPPQDPVSLSASTTCNADANANERTPSCLSEEKIKFEKERRKWEEWRHKEEIKWHKKMREQELAAMKSLDEESKAKEKQRVKAAEASRQELFERETRLRKASAEVDKRERRVRTLEASREVEYTTKMAEAQLKERIVTEEIAHAVAIEVSLTFSVVCF